MSRSQELYVYLLLKHTYILLHSCLKDALIFDKGAFNIYVDKILAFFDHLPTPNKQTQ